jgi:hypothetical protein
LYPLRLFETLSVASAAREEIPVHLEEWRFKHSAQRHLNKSGLCMYYFAYFVKYSLCWKTVPNKIIDRNVFCILCHILDILRMSYFGENKVVNVYGINLTNMLDIQICYN